MMKKLNSQELSILREKFPIIKFQAPFDLVYEKQIPNTGIVLLEGELELHAKNKSQEKVPIGTLLGVHQLIKNEPVKLGCRVRENAEVIVIQKSDILDAFEGKNPDLLSIIKS